MKLNKKSLFAIGIAIATMIVVFACTPPVIDGGDGTIDTNTPAVTVLPSGNITTNKSFVLMISVDENYGYWSTNFVAFVQFSTGTDVILNNTGSITNLRVYGEDISNNVSTTNVSIYIFNWSAGIYVSTSGDDANDGLSPANAVLTIQDAILLATNAGRLNVYVETGIYIQGAGLSNTVVGNNYAGVNIINANNINLIGGWDGGFMAQTGYSELDGIGVSATNKHIIWAENTTNLTIDGFVIRGGNADTSNPHNYGGGILITNVLHSLIINCTISNNNADAGGGGGIMLYYSDYDIINATVSDNSAFYGGGIYALGLSNTISRTILNNTTPAGGYGGGVYIHAVSSNNTISGTILDNTAMNGGGVYNGGKYTIISGTISGNTVSAFGGGVHNNGSAYWTGDWGSGNTPQNWSGTAALP